LNTIDKYTDPTTFAKLISDEISDFTDDYMTSVATRGFMDCKSLNSITLPNVSALSGTQIFKGCSNLKTINLKSVTAVTGTYNFDYCTSLIEIKLPKVTTIAAYTFNNCTALTDIYVPFASDSSSAFGAPWGATNATVHYSTVFDEDGNPVTT